jgi:hypothetical protein
LNGNRTPGFDLTAAIQAKIAKVAKYREQTIVAATEPVIIAMNQGAIVDSDLNDIELPLAMRILYGVGGTVMTVEIGTGTTNVEVRYRSAIHNTTRVAGVDLHLRSAHERGRCRADARPPEHFSSLPRTPTQTDHGA